MLLAATALADKAPIIIDDETGAPVDNRTVIVAEEEEEPEPDLSEKIEIAELNVTSRIDGRELAVSLDLTARESRMS